MNIYYENGEEKTIDSFNELENVIQVIKIYCYVNESETLEGLEGCINLRELSCNFNKLTTLKGIDRCVSLRQLYCINNKLTTLKGIDRCVNLQNLYCINNQLTTLKGLESCVNLRILKCNNNKLKTLEGLEGCINLQNLYCDFYLEIQTTLTFITYNYDYDLDILTDMIIEKNIDKLLENNYNNFIKCKYFNDHKVEVVKKYNLVGFYDEVFLTIQNTDENCMICMDDTFSRYIQCNNKHVMCYDCYKCLMNKRRCCVCNYEYHIKEMYYAKN